MASDPALISSSPEFPSLINLAPDKPHKGLHGGISRTTRLPPICITSTISVTHLLEQLEDELEARSEDAPEVRPPPRTSHSGHPSAADIESFPQGVVPPRIKEKRETTKANTVSAPKTVSVGNMTREESKTVPVRRIQANSATVSKHFPLPLASAGQYSAPESFPAQDPLNLEPALRRRLDWTPPKKSCSHPATYLDADPEIPSSDPSGSGAHQVFNDLSGSFGFKTNHNLSAAPEDEMARAVLGKRKTLDMVVIGRPSDVVQAPIRSVTLKKPKSPCKKARTITELATAAYRDTANGDEATAVGDLEAEEQICRPTSGARHAQQARQNSGSGPGSRKAKSKKKVTSRARPRPLLSPSSAMRQLSRQDFVFGTSSQLALAKSPSLLQGVQPVAIVSANDDRDPFASSPITLALPAKSARSKNLWAAGARDGDGDLMNVQVVNLADSPTHSSQLYDVRGRPCLSHPRPKQATDAEAMVTPQVQSSASACSNSQVPTQLNNPDPREFQTQLQVAEASGCVSLSTATDEAPYSSCANDSEPPASNQEQNKLLNALKDAPANKSTAGISCRPKYELFTDAKLATEIALYGFKPVKRRTAMIALLDQCWISRMHIQRETSPQPSNLRSITAAAGGADSLPGKAVTSAPRTKRPRGRPRKDASLTSAANTSASPPKPRGRGPGKIVITSGDANDLKPAEPEQGAPTTRHGSAVIEIADSDSEKSMLIPDAPPASSLSPQPADLSISDETELNIALSQTSQDAHLFRYITKAVTTAPRSSDAAKPSWYEKMLLYDPIVLEELAAWLNAGQLDRVGFDGEVSAFDVKKWCESKSVACLWKVNLRGQERRRL